MKVSVKINLEAAIRWERLTDRPFSTLDYSDEEDIIRLCYCASLAADPSIKKTYKLYREAFDGSAALSKKTIREVASLNAFMAQFQPKSEDVPREDADSSEPLPRLDKIAAQLIIAGGMDADYVLHDMPIEYIPMFIEGIAEKTKQTMEWQRYMVWLLLQPYDSKKQLSSPQKICTFPYERVEAEKQAAATIEKHRKELDAFFAGELFDPTKHQWKVRK